MENTGQDTQMFQTQIMKFIDLKLEKQTKPKHTYVTFGSLIFGIINESKVEFD